MNQPEKCTDDTSRRLGRVGMALGDDESTRLTSSGEARSLNSLLLPLQAAEVEQYPLDKIYFKIHEERIQNNYLKGLFTSIQHSRVYYMHSFKAKMTRAYPGE